MKRGDEVSELFTFGNIRCALRPKICRSNFPIRECTHLCDVNKEGRRGYLRGFSAQDLQAGVRVGGHDHGVEFVAVARGHLHAQGGEGGGRRDACHLCMYPASLQICTGTSGLLRLNAAVQCTEEGGKVVPTQGMFISKSSYELKRQNISIQRLGSYFLLIKSTQGKEQEKSNSTVKKGPGERIPARMAST